MDFDGSWAEIWVHELIGVKRSAASKNTHVMLPDSVFHKTFISNSVN